ncbi:hypothetical protein GCM10011514_11170 [Emticicia aquatilis]|uniref:Uncharacterized protein n=1 Tax=Emticicia aquatilis TaxID=1537369 RepID=A0A916YK62_9BACT|nr:hypothetical protein GCM10011514_11170 [Emticicia aquatilis]
MLASFTIRLIIQRIDKQDIKTTKPSPNGKGSVIKNILKPTINKSNTIRIMFLMFSVQFIEFVGGLDLS